jgi:hypothetical protein
MQRGMPGADRNYVPILHVQEVPQLLFERPHVTTHAEPAKLKRFARRVKLFLFDSRFENGRSLLFHHVLLTGPCPRPRAHHEFLLAADDILIP